MHANMYLRTQYKGKINDGVLEDYSKKILLLIWHRLKNNLYTILYNNTMINNMRIQEIW